MKQLGLMSLLCIALVGNSFATYFNKIGSEFRVNTTTINSQGNPCIATRGDGNYVIAWCSNQTGDADIYAQRYNSSDVGIGSEFLVNSCVTGSQGMPSIAMRKDGIFIIAWASNSQDGSSYGIYAQRFDSTGAKVGSEFQVNTYTPNEQSYPSIAIRSDGGFVITWHSVNQDGSGYGVYAQCFDSAGVKVGLEFQVNTYTINHQAYPSIAMKSDGGFVITWASNEQDSIGGYGVYAQRFSPEGVKIGSEFLVNTYKTGNQYEPDIAMKSDGGFIITWDSYGQDGPGLAVYAQRFDSAGGKIGSEFQVNTYTLGNQYGPSVAIRENGSFAITWHSDGQDGSGLGVYGQSFDSLGIKVYGEFHINTYTNSNQYYPMISLGRKQQFVATWQSYLQDGLGDGIYAQRFSGYVVVQAALSSPNGNEAWVVNTQHAVLWTPVGDTAEKVRLEYSTDGGATYQVIVDSTFNDGSYSWSIPNDPSRNCKVRIVDYKGNEILDVSDNVFTIRPVNQAPVITSPAADTAVATVGFSYTATATDSWDPVTFSFTNLPGWLIVSGNQVLGMAPANAADTSFKVIAFDGELSDTVIVSLAVFTLSEAAYKPSSVFSDPNGLYKGDIKWADMDNDNYLDFVCMGQDKNTSLFTRSYRNVNGSSFTVRQSLVGLFSGGLDVADYNNDQYMDFVQCGNQSTMGTQARSFLYKNTAGTVNGISAVFDSLWESAIAFFDYDNDGDYDVVMAGADNKGVLKTLVYRNETGVFIHDVAQNLIGVTEASLAYGDLDKDMDMDLVVCGFSESGPITRVYRNDKGKFVNWQALPGVSEGAVACADYNHDGNLELILTGNGIDSALTKVYDNNGSGILTENTLQKIPGVYNSSVMLGDYDNNGSLDLFISGYTGTQRITRIYLNKSNIFTALNRGTAFPGVWYGALSLADFDKDGDLDFLMSGDTGGTGKEFDLYENMLDDYSAVNQPPTAPGTLSAVQTDSGEVTLRWRPATDPQGGPVTYNIRVGSTAGDDDIEPAHSDMTTGWRKVVCMGNVQADTSWKIRDLDIGRFYWSVQTVDGAYAGSAWAAEKQFMIVRVGAPTLVSPTNNALNVAVNPALRWTSVPGATSYRVQVSVDSMFATTLRDTSGLADTSCTISGLANGVRYFWRAAAVVATATGWSPAWNFTTIVALPAPVITLLPQVNDTVKTSNVLLVWAKGSPAVTAYRLEVATDSGFTNITVLDSTITDTTKQVVGLAWQTTYWWRVKAKNAAGWGQFGAAGKFITYQPPVSVMPREYNVAFTGMRVQGPVITYALPRESRVSLYVYDLRGRKIFTVINRMQQPGLYTVRVNAGTLAQGVHIMVFKAGDYAVTKKVFVAR